MSVSEADIQRAAEILEQGGVVAFPTETVYGLGALASDADAITRLYEMKGRPTERALIVHLCHGTALDVWAVRVPDYAYLLAQTLWPGPLTLVLPRAGHVSELVTGGGDTVGLRVPDHPVAQRLLVEIVERRGLGVGVAAPSANRFGEPPPRTAAEVVAGLGAPSVDDYRSPDMILDGGMCPGGVPSTVLACDGLEPRILRAGAIARETIEDVIGMRVVLPTAV